MAMLTPCTGCDGPIDLAVEHSHESLDGLKIFHAECCFQDPGECDLLHPGDPDYEWDNADYD